MLDVQCEHCGRMLKIPEEYLGQQGTCNHCKGRIAVLVKPVTFSASAIRAAAEMEEEDYNARRRVLAAVIEVLSRPLTEEQEREEVERRSRDVKYGFWKPDEEVPLTGTYACQVCGPDGMGVHLFRTAFKETKMRYWDPPFVLRQPPRVFLKKGECFASCPYCRNDQPGFDATIWMFVS